MKIMLAFSHKMWLLVKTNRTDFIRLEFGETSLFDATSRFLCRIVLISFHLLRINITASPLRLTMNPGISLIQNVEANDES